jgi:membrane fusion protein (multidrug efflux system)
MPPVPVEVSTVMRTTVTDRFEAVGSTQAGDEVLVATEIQGVVSALPFQEGSWVTKGQVLAQLDDSELAADVARAEAVRDQQLTTYERWKSVVEQKAGAQQDLDDAEARYKIAEAELAVARVRLSKTRITAPFSGNAGARRVSVGAFLNPGDPITMLASTDEIRVTFSAPERYVPVLRRGSSVAIGVTAYPGEQWFGRIDVVDPVLSEATRSVQILARVPNPDGRLRPGMSANVSAVLEERPDSMTLPSEAVFAEGNQFFAFVVNPDSTVARVQLSLGSRTPTSVEILNEIEPGTMVVKAGHQKLFPGARVMPMPSQEPPAAEHPVTGTETPPQAPNAPDTTAQTAPATSQAEAKDDTP